MTECARCGDCCERIPFRLLHADITRKLADPYLAGRTRYDLQFIADHWHLLNQKYWQGDNRAHPDRDHDGCCMFSYGGSYSCDQFNPETRECMAHTTRPPICRDYPWYGRKPGEIVMSPRCSFRADLPIGMGGLLPLTVVPQRVGHADQT